MSYLIALDVGIKNLGMCVFDFTCAKIVFWDNLRLSTDSVYKPKNNVLYVKEFVLKYKRYFDNAFQIVIERQIRTNMRIIEAVFQTLYYDIVKVISARSVKVHFNLSMKNYRANKAKAVEFAKSFATSNANAFEVDLREVPFRKGKMDDIADSLLLCLYYLDTYSNQMQYIFTNVAF